MQNYGDSRGHNCLFKCTGILENEAERHKVIEIGVK